MADGSTAAEAKAAATMTAAVVEAATAMATLVAEVGEGDGVRGGGARAAAKAVGLEAAGQGWF